MKRCFCGLFFFIFMINATHAEVHITGKDIAKYLKKNLRHPYLFFTEAEKPAIRERIKNNSECRIIMDRLLAECNRLMYLPVEPVPPQPREHGAQLFDNSPAEFETVMNLYRDAAYKLAFVYQMTDDEKYARKSFEFAKEICDTPTWVFRLCQFPKAYYRVSPWNVTDDKVVFTFAIVASDTASLIAMVYDWLYPALSEAERDWIRGGLLEKAITQVRGNYDYHWWSTAYRCNWCAWCNTGLGLAALTLLTEDPNLTDVVAESYNRISRTLSQIGIDGGWSEGASYWGQTTRMSILFADALKRVTNNRWNHFKHPKLTKNPVNFPLYTSVPPDGSVNFADASGRHRIGASRLYNKIALETGDGTAAWMHKNWFNTGNDIFDIIWSQHTVKPGIPGKTSIHFRTIDWVIMRSDFTDPEKVMVACKAGKNDDPHHGHLDVGQFMIYWRGQAFIKDLGAAAYDEKFFDAEKYDTPHASSRGHNLIFVNSEEQVTGKRYKQPLDESIGGKILEFRDGESRVYTLMDPTNAYPGKELKTWRRHIILEKPEITVIVDEVESGKGAEIEARFHSECEQIAKEDYTLLDGKDGDMALIPVVGGEFTFRPDRHAYQALFKNAGIKWIPYNGTVLHASDNRTIIVHIILPVTDDSEARAIVKSAVRLIEPSGNFTLSFTKNEETYIYHFQKGKDGLVLK